MKILLIFLLLPSCIYAAAASDGVYGADSIHPITVANFTCLAKKENYQFFIARLFRTVGEVDEVGIQNIINARAAGWSFVDAYFIPCLKDGCPTAKEQIELALNAATSKGAQIGIFWISIQVLNCNTTLQWPLTQNCNESWENWPWSANFTFNQAFIIEMVKQAEAMGFKVGIYAGRIHWEKIVGREWNGVADKPLWFARFWKTHDFTEYDIPFGGWEMPSMRNYAQNHFSEKCNVTINLSWYPE